MSARVIEIEGLTKDYRHRKGRRAALDRLDLSVFEGGQVYGFLGPNGSGKTTTIRCLLGLVRPSRGRLRLLGHDVPTGLPLAMRRVGAIVEGPALFPTMTGRENLMLLAAIDGIARRRVDQALEEVHLAERAGDLVKKYSLGMRQRLAIAAALLKDPALVVLDEPANGLDPAGIRQVRELMRRLAGEGRTVFLSTHILSEVEQTCDRVAILRHGRCVAEGTVESVLASGQPRLVVKVDDLASGHDALVRRGIPTELRDTDLRVDLPPTAAACVSQALAGAGLWVTELRPEERTLEDHFLELTDDERAPARQPALSRMHQEVGI